MPEKLHPNEVSPSFCLLPWIHLSTRPNGHMRLCCTANASSAGSTNDREYGGEVGILKTEGGSPANLGHQSLGDAWNNGFMRKVRRQMLEGEWPTSCLKCHKEENASARSKRIWETEYWSSRIDVNQVVEQTQTDGTSVNPLRYVDLRMGTKCNLKCIMCSPHDSSAWVDDWHQFMQKAQNPNLVETMQWSDEGRRDGASYTWHRDNPAFWEDILAQLPHLKQLYFAGGEPLIIEDHYLLLEECVKRGEAHHIELRYNSNGLVLPEKLFALWEHFQRVRFHFSIDSVGPMNDYIRYPSPWRRVEDNLRRLDQTPDSIEVTIACAVQALNIFYLPELVQWKLDSGFKKINPWPLGAGLLNYHLVYHPAHLNVKVLPKKFKARVRRKIEAFCQNLLNRPGWPAGFSQSGYGVKRLLSLVKFMESEDWSNRMPEMREYIRVMDEIRGTSFAKTFPEMGDLIEGREEKYEEVVDRLSVP